ncbi:MAG: radical SAM protein [Dehalococcoidia bacterium]|jgi:MoaA/NifB/PqqE/SkfB family radical SAM enzyme
MNNSKQYEEVTFEIVGYCNAKCPYCTTGSKSLKLDVPAKCIEPDDFNKAILALLDKGLISPRHSIIHLYSWGEPLLHPQLAEILRILVKNRINFGISTNASKSVHFDSDILANLKYIKLSMPGFSQSSYDKIHGFNFNKVIKNIELLCKNVKVDGSNTKLEMCYHLYQFNVGEIGSAAKFCRENDINFSPYMAYLNDYNLMRSYLDKTLSKELLSRIAKDLFLYYVDEFINKMPQNYNCPQHDVLTIDENCNILTCCFLPKSHPAYSLGNLHILSGNEIVSSKRSQRVCTECTKLGIAYWAYNQLIPEYVQDFISIESAVGNELSKSKFYRLGRSILWQIRYIIDFFK